MKTVATKRGDIITVDDQDYDLVSRYAWRLNKQGYAIGCVPTGKRGGRHVLIQRMLTNAGPDQKVDHRDGDPLNNTRDNLRVCTDQQNCRNSIGRPANRRSQFKGVHWDKQMKCWRSYIRAEGKSIYLGIFNDDAEAARAYDEAARKYHGNFACLNFPEEDQQGSTERRCQLCNRRQGVISLIGLYDHQKFIICLACLRFASENAKHGHSIRRSEKARSVPGSKPVIVKGET